MQQCALNAKLTIPKADIWVDWIEMELGLDNFVDAEQLFGRCLMTVPNVKLWTVYLNYIRRRNDLNNDASGQARRTITQSYEFVIDNIGVDRDSGNIWQDYVQFVKNGPGQIGGTGWQDQQKMDQLRKVYQRAIAIPMLTVNNLWKEYDQFEMGLNKMTVRTSNLVLLWNAYSYPGPKVHPGALTRVHVSKECQHSLG